MSTFRVVLRAAGLLLGSLLAVCFGFVPFALGIVAQACVPRRLPSYVADLVAAAVFLLVWLITGSVPFVVTRNGHFSLWQSAFASWLVAVACFHAGATLLRALWPQRFGSGPSPNNALQRTEAGGRLFLALHVFLRQPPSLSLDPLGLPRHPI